jgi:hypothetical protein
VYYFLFTLFLSLCKKNLFIFAGFSCIESTEVRSTYAIITRPRVLRCATYLLNNNNRVSIPTTFVYLSVQFFSSLLLTVLNPKLLYCIYVFMIKHNPFYCYTEKWEGPNSGITSFDNIGLAMLTVFQVYYN